DFKDQSIIVEEPKDVGIFESAQNNRLDYDYPNFYRWGICSLYTFAASFAFGSIRGLSAFNQKARENPEGLIKLQQLSNNQLSKGRLATSAFFQKGFRTAYFPAIFAGTFWGAECTLQRYRHKFSFLDGVNEKLNNAFMNLPNINKVLRPEDYFRIENKMIAGCLTAVIMSGLASVTAGRSQVFRLLRLGLFSGIIGGAIIGLITIPMEAVKENERLQTIPVELKTIKTPGDGVLIEEVTPEPVEMEKLRDFIQEERDFLESLDGIYERKPTTNDENNKTRNSI
ncbi:hypothetical protein AKO1_008693, partial [Acrasis kona]